MKVALCFYGITRNGKTTTIPSIHKHIYNVLRKNNIEYDIYIHTYNLQHENGIPIDNNDFLLLNPTEYMVENQDEVDTTLEIEKYCSIFQNIYDKNTIYNLARSYHSKMMVWNLVEKSGKTYDTIIALRPDVKYLIDINVSLLNVKQNEIIVPNFSPTINKLLFSCKSTITLKKMNKITEINDRFAIGNMDVMQKYLQVGDHVLQYTGNTETVLRSHLKTNKIQICVCNMKFHRIRSNGDNHDKHKFRFRLAIINLVPSKKFPLSNIINYWNRHGFNNKKKYLTNI